MCGAICAAGALVVTLDSLVSLLLCVLSKRLKDGSISGPAMQGLVAGCSAGCVQLAGAVACKFAISVCLIIVDILMLMHRLLQKQRKAQR
jgi:hypothetical protein